MSNDNSIKNNDPGNNVGNGNGNVDSGKLTSDEHELINEELAKNEVVKDELVRNDEFTPEADVQSLKAKSIRGGFVTGAGQILRIAISFGSQLILGRLLFPEDFGLVAMVAPVLALVDIFRSLGLSQAVVTSETLAQDDLNALYWLQLGLSSGLAIAMMACAPLIAWLYGQPSLVWVVVALAVQIPLGAVAGHAGAIMSRRMQFAALSMIDVSIAVFQLIVTVAAALLGARYWSLIIGSGLGAVLRVVLEMIVSGWRPGRPRWSATVAPMIRTGGHVTGYNLLSYLSYYLDNVLVGIVSGPAALGFFDRSFNLVLRPIGSLTAPIAAVAVPYLSRVRGHPEEYRRAYLIMLQGMLLIATPGLLTFAMLPTEVVGFLLGPHWLPMVHIFGAISIAAIFTPFSVTSYWLFASQERVAEQLRTAFFSTGMIIVAMFAGLAWGAVGIAIAYAAFAPVVHGCYSWVVGRTGPVTRKDLLVAIWPIVIASTVALAANYAVSRWVELPVLPKILVAALLSYSAAIITMLMFPAGRSLFGFALKAVGELRRKRAPVAGGPASEAPGVTRPG